jgi:hypothetical protein
MKATVMELPRDPWRAIGAPGGLVDLKDLGGQSASAR